MILGCVSSSVELGPLVADTFEVEGELADCCALGCCGAPFTPGGTAGAGVDVIGSEPSGCCALGCCGAPFTPGGTAGAGVDVIGSEPAGCCALGCCGAPFTPGGTAGAGVDVIGSEPAGCCALGCCGAPFTPGGTAGAGVDVIGSEPAGCCALGCCGAPFTPGGTAGAGVDVIGSEPAGCCELGCCGVPFTPGGPTGAGVDVIGSEPAGCCALGCCGAPFTPGGTAGAGVDVIGSEPAGCCALGCCGVPFTLGGPTGGGVVLVGGDPVGCCALGCCGAPFTPGGPTGGGVVLVGGDPAGCCALGWIGLCFAQMMLSAPPKDGLSGDEEKIYDLICRRLLSAWHDDYVVAVTTVITSISNGEVVDRYRTSGSAVQQMGWKALDFGVDRKKRGKATADADSGEETLPPGLALGQKQDVQDVEALSRKTRAPKRFTEATLLTAMETAGKTLDERELSEAMKASGLGTPATRASIIEVLLKREYIERRGKNLEATVKGIRLIEVVHPEVKSPAMTGQWEAHLQRIQRGTAKLEPFLNGIENYVREVVGRVEMAQPTERIVEASELPTSDASRPALSGNALTEILASGFGFGSFRLNQEAVCRAAVEGRDVLLVMPTGSGKSLCYQLPGIARGGTTLVISPLIALMEDQVAKLQERGFAVECIHSGRDRGDSRQACVAYLAGRLQFLFIAPERLRVAGFPEMLAKRKPSLIAIDEAHCISQWGHDFRPDYRMLGQHLPLLRPAPVIALTATATPLVQQDICQQLKLQDAAHFVHGFRRDNIAIEVVEASPSERLSRIAEVLADPARRPAIVYTPTRKQAEEVARELMRAFAASAYHAGLDPEHRRKVQQEFLANKIEVIVATIAFGMGIDKPNVRTVIHTALPGSLEGYYQEIGRAGRDGLPSRALLMQSYADRHTHDFFLQRDYPEVAMLDRMFAALTEQPVKKTHLQKHLKIDTDLFDKALEKLWAHGGAGVDYEENITRGEDRWRAAYLLQARQRSAQIELVIRFSSSNACRMSTLVRHFGDVADTGTACGLCDFCAPAACIAQRYRTATQEEKTTLFRILAAVRSRGSLSTGKLYSGLFPHAEMSRDSFESVLGAMARAGLLLQTDETFEKDRKRIPYRTVRLTQQGQQVDERSPISFVMKDISAPARKAARKRKLNGTKQPAERKRATTRSETKPKKSGKAPVAVATPGLEVALRTWRLQEARRRNVPAFRIFNDQVLRSIVSDLPKNRSHLLAISGVGSNLAKQYGDQICSLVKQHANS